MKKASSANYASFFVRIAPCGIADYSPFALAGRNKIILQNRDILALA